MRGNLDLLNNVCLAILESGAWGNRLWRDAAGFVNLELSGFAALLRAGTLPFGGLLLRRVLSLAGTNLRLGLVSLQPGDLIPEMLELFSLVVNDLQQLLHQRCLLCLWNVWQLGLKWLHGCFHGLLRESAIF